MTVSRRAFLAGAAALAATRGRGGTAVETGLDVAGSEPWTGRRVGVLAHAASYAGDGRFVVDVLREAGATVVRLFAPEHGLLGRVGAGDAVADGAAAGLEVVSLYGTRRRPEPRHVAGLDALVVDLQDAGVRFYTYAATMLDALDVANAAGVETVLLDRPNPLGGAMVDGVPASSEPSIFNRVPGPLVHGLTLGEIARLVRPGARLRVVRMRGWSREQRWPDTGLPWRPPSPNLRSAEAALAYPGTALLEATNVSEGRGTDAPFLTVGAPWLPPDFARGVVSAGFDLEVIRFTPVPSEAAPKPKHAGLECVGARVHVRDARRARPWHLGVALLHALRRHRRFALAEDGRALDRLVATDRLRRRLEAGQGVDEIVAAGEDELERWRATRAPALLY